MQKRVKFIQNFTRIKFQFGMIGTGTGHYGVTATKISPLSTILLKLATKGNLGEKNKFCKNSTPDKFHFGIIGTGIGHYGVIATKISPLSTILLKLAAKMQFGGQKPKFYKNRTPTTFFLASLEPA